MNTDVLSPLDILRNIGSRFKEYRLRFGMTQKDVAYQTGLSIVTISNFENGNITDISAANLFKLMRAVNQEKNWDKLIPELPDSPYMYKQSARRQRIRHKNPKS